MNREVYCTGESNLARWQDTLPKVLADIVGAASVAIIRGALRSIAEITAPTRCCR